MSWNQNNISKYIDLINNSNKDSEYIRRAGLKTSIGMLVGDYHKKNILDIGCGDGWLLKYLNPDSGSQCDIIHNKSISSKYELLTQDICALTYKSNKFDIVIANLVLMFIDDLDKACKEISRVVSKNGEVIISLTHPAFYRTGEVSNGNFIVSENYLKERTITDLMIGGAVGPFTFYHRPLSHYINKTIAAGLDLMETYEWGIDKNDYNKEMVGKEFTIERTDKVPILLFLKYKKVK
jgi:ubiquinone/menaquinone biosynthesis C-methylase UbiE